MEGLLGSPLGRYIWKEGREGGRGGRKDGGNIDGEKILTHYAVAIEVSADCTGSSGPRINLQCCPKLRCGTGFCVPTPASQWEEV